MNWGILGCGRIAHKFATDLLALPSAKVHAVASTSLVRAQEFGAKYQATHTFGSYEGLLNCPDLDVVYVATPHVLHHQNALMLLRAGVAVLGEKPFAMHLAQAQEMVQTARENNVFLMEALWTRFMPVTLQMLQIINSGAIGEVQLLQADFGFKAENLPEGRLLNPALGGGALLDIGIYPVFLAYLVFGKPLSINASAVFGETGVDVQDGITLTYANGQMANLSCTLLAKTPCEGLIYGEKGIIKIHTRWHESTALTLELYEDNISGAAKIASSETFHFERSTFGYNYEAQHVEDCLTQSRTESPAWTLQNSLELTELLDQIRAKTAFSD